MRIDLRGDNDDYEWASPGVIMVDEDPAMETACASLIPNTVIVSCIWHLGSLNLAKNLRGALGPKWESFLSRFWRARNALTPDELETKWSAITSEFGVQGRRLSLIFGGS